VKRRIFGNTIFVRWWDEDETCYALGKDYGRSLIVRTLSMMVFMLLLAGGSQQLAAQAFTNVTAIHVQSNIGGTLLQDGKVCFYPTDQNDLLVTVNDGLGGIVSPNSPACGAITSGVIAGGFQVANSALTNPAGIYYRIQITDLCGACLNKGKDHHRPAQGRERHRCHLVARQLCAERRDRSALEPVLRHDGDRRAVESKRRHRALVLELSDASAIVPHQRRRELQPLRRRRRNPADERHEQCQPEHP
jgi:hypothetical protein